MLSPGSSGTGGRDGWVMASVPPSLVPAPPPYRGGHRVSTPLWAGLAPSWCAGRMPVPQPGPTWHGRGECNAGQHRKTRARWQPGCPKPNLVHPPSVPPRQYSLCMLPPKHRVTSPVGTGRSQRPQCPKASGSTSPASPGIGTGSPRAGAVPPQMHPGTYKNNGFIRNQRQKTLKKMTIF